MLEILVVDILGIRFKKVSLELLKHSVLNLANVKFTINIPGPTQIPFKTLAIGFLLISSVA